MIIRYYNRVEATEVADLNQAQLIVHEERKSGKKRFHLVPKKELLDHIEFEEFENDMIRSAAESTAARESNSPEVRHLALSILASMRREKKFYHI